MSLDGDGYGTVENHNFRILDEAEGINYGKSVYINLNT